MTGYKAQPKKEKLFVLIVMDGWGISARSEGNAIKEARTPFISESLLNYPVASLLPFDPAMGAIKEGIKPSRCYEILGAGRNLAGAKTRIDEAIKNKSFYRNRALRGAMARAKSQQSKLHLVGQVSLSDVHSSLAHLNALLVLAGKEGIKDVFLHVISDGKDTSAQSGVKAMAEIMKRLEKKKIGRIASLAGRLYAQDESANFNRTKRAFEAMRGRPLTKKPPLEYQRDNYARKIFDEDMMPVWFDDGRSPVGRIENNDVVIFYNFHPAGLRQLVSLFLSARESKTKQFLRNIHLVTLAEYEKDWPLEIAFPATEPVNTLGKAISTSGRKQKRISLAENHILLNCCFDHEEKIENCERLLIETKEGNDYGMDPVFGLDIMAKQLTGDINSESYNFLLAGTPNVDLAARAGNYAAAVKAWEATDRLLANIAGVVLKKDGILMIASLYGRAEEVSFGEGAVSPIPLSHNPVPLLVINKDLAGFNLGWPDISGGDLSLVNPIGTIADIAPTVLGLMGITPTREMTGHCLFSDIK